MGKTVILGCSSLKDFIDNAQKKAGTDYQVIYLNRLYHRDPAEMREHVIEALEKLDPEVDTVLVSMGFCGGSWDKVKVPVRLVIPRIDDCVSLLLQLTDEPVSDLKDPRHLYIKDRDPKNMCFRDIFDKMTVDLDEETRDRYHRDWMSYYDAMDIIDTGIYDVHDPKYADPVRADADWLEAEMNYVPGGTYLLEKLFTGNWDGQFMIFDPGEITENILMPC